MRSTLFLALLSVNAVFAAKWKNASSSACVCTQFSQIAAAVANCTDIRLQDIKAPTNSTIDLSKVKANSVVTFAGTTSFEFTNSSTFNPISFGGKNVTITSYPGAIIDGNGSMYWDGLGSNGGLPKPNNFIKVKMTNGSVIKNLHIQNWPAHGFSIGSSSDLTIRNIYMDNSFGDLPNNRSKGLSAAHNSDGFGVGALSNNILIDNCTVYNQDDCVAVTSGNNITASNIFCSGTHGLSIGSIGGKANNNVTNVLFTNSSLRNSTNGARIKSNFNTTGYIANITYSNIQIFNASDYGIDVQQDYLNGGPTGIPSNGVIIENVLFKNISGTATTKGTNYYVLCGEGSCKNVAFEEVRITGGGVNSTCNYPTTGCPAS